MSWYDPTDREISRAIDDHIERPMEWERRCADEELSDDEILKELPKRKEEPKRETKALNERQHWLDLTSQMLGKPIPMIARKVQGWPMEWVRDMYLYVNRAEVSNPPALWWHLYNNPKQPK